MEPVGRPHHRLCGAATVLILIALGPAAAQSSRKYAAYQENWSRAQNARLKGDYETAATYYARVAELIPYEPSSRYYLACSLAQTGRTEAALASLEKAIQFGWDDPDAIASEDDELAPLRSDARLGRLVTAARACRAEKVALYAGKSVSPTVPAPLLIVLHGRGGHPRCYLPHFASIADRHGLLVVAPRGVRALGNRLAYAWDKQGAQQAIEIDTAAAYRAISHAVSVAEAQYAVNRERILLAGFSQGGAVALRALAEQPGRFVGALTVCTVYPGSDAPAWSAAARQSRRVFMIAGELDVWLSSSRRIRDELRGANIAIEYVEIKGMGHEFPDEFARLQQNALDFLLPS